MQNREGLAACCGQWGVDPTAVMGNCAWVWIRPVFSYCVRAASSKRECREAGALPVKAVTAAKAGKTKAVDMFNRGEGGFVDRDLYVFCLDVSDGKVIATGNSNSRGFLGQGVRTVKDADGRAYGQEFYTAAQKPEGQLTAVSYLAPGVGANKTPVPKAGWITRASDLGCGEGYYK